MTPLRLVPSTRVSPHFRWGEFAQPDGALPPRALYVPVRDLCMRYLEPLRLAYGAVIVTSGYRSPAHNAAIGGAPASRHVPSSEPNVAAADVYCRSGTPREWYAALNRLGAGGLGLYLTHVHVDTRRLRARW